MKKLLILLLSLALFLTSCTGRDGGGTTVPDTTAPDTTAPDTTAPDTTAPEVTTAETTAYVEPTGTQPTVTYYEGSEDPWYFSWKPGFTYRSYLDWLDALNLSEEDKQYAIQTPIVYETVSDGFSVRIDFFREFYRRGSLFQVRITLKNETGRDLRLIEYSDSLGMRLSWEDKWGDSKFFEREKYMIPAEDYYNQDMHDGNIEFTLKAGETRVFDRVIWLTYLPSKEEAELDNMQFVCYFANRTDKEGIEFRVDLPIVKLPRRVRS